MKQDMPPKSGFHLNEPATYARYLVLIAGLGGLLYGIDIGIISAALIYLSHTVDLTVKETSAIVAAVLGGSMLSSPVAGLLADRVGRKPMIIVSGLLFVASVVLIALSHGFMVLFLGRLLQGISGGVIAVVVPLYLAECLSASKRGSGSSIFQLMLTIGIVVAALTGWFFIRRTEIAIAAAGGDLALIRIAEDHAWRGMFLSVAIPGMLFLLGSFALSESPRWLFRKGRTDDAYRALCRALPEEQATLELDEMQAQGEREQGQRVAGEGSLLQRRYVYPFLLACAILMLNQTTGINSILAYLAVILRQAGLSAVRSTQGDVAVKVLNVVMTLVGVAFVDRKGRKFLLSIGTGGVVVALVLAAALFHGFETQKTEQRVQLEHYIQHNQLDLSPAELRGWNPGDARPASLTVLYTYGDGEKLVTMATTDAHPLALRPEGGAKGALQIEHAFVGPLPEERTGWLVAGCMGLFISCFALGPAVVVWLALSELMPSRIRSVGMGIALLLNQGVSTLIAGAFLPATANFGYADTLLLWGACTLIYFLIAVFLLPETKGKTLEEIEESFQTR